MFERRARDQHADRAGDAELSSAIAQGGEAAIAAAYRRHGGLVYRFSLRLSQDPSIAEEVTQEVFLALLRQPDRFDPSRALLSTWLCGIARRLLWKELERRQRHAPLNRAEDAGEAESPADDPAAALSRKEEVAALQQGIDALPLPLKAVVVLCELEEMSYEDAAQVLEIPVGTVRSRLHRAKARLGLLLGRDPVNATHEGRI